MTDRQMRSLCKWAEGIAATMRLSPGWDIFFHESEPSGAEDGSDAIASVSCVFGRRIAHITVGPAFFGANPEEQRHALIHEFLHILTWNVGEIVKTTMPELIGAIGWNAFRPGFVAADEHATDAITSAIEDFFPLWVP